MCSDQSSQWAFELFTVMCRYKLALALAACLSIIEIKSGAPVARRAANGAPYPYREIKETHKLIFSCYSGQRYFSWARMHDDGDGGAAQHGIHPCIWLARGKFELTNQDSAGGKKIHCPHANVSWQERHWNQSTFPIGDCIKYSLKGIYNSQNHSTLQKVKNMKHLVSPSFQFGAK